MILTLQRQKPKAPGYPVLGRLYVDGLDLHTLEDPYVLNPTHPSQFLSNNKFHWPWTPWKIPGVTAISEGKYRAYLTFSPRFRRLLPLLTNVKGYEGIRMHMGVSAEHSEGCIVVGTDIQHARMLIGGGSAEDQLVSFFQKHELEEIWVDVKNWIEQP